MTAKTERLVNLTVALLASPRPLTFVELRTRMGEWDDGAAESMRRKFERDKDELRRLGVPIETVETDALGGELAYRIDPAAYSLPDVELTVAQMTVLAVAFQLVDGGADQLTFSKVAARAPDPTGADVPSGISVRAADVDAIAPLATAIMEGRVVRFTHRKTTGERMERELEPAALLSRRGTWYVWGHDLVRDEPRIFRIDRLEGDVTLTDATVSHVTRSDVPDMSLFELPDEIDITVAVRTGDGWTEQPRRDRWFRATSRSLGATPDEVIVHPVDARDAVVDALGAVLATHGASTEVTP